MPIGPSGRRGLLFRADIMIPSTERGTPLKRGRKHAGACCSGSWSAGWSALPGTWLYRCGSSSLPKYSYITDRAPPLDDAYPAPIGFMFRVYRVVVG